MMLSAGREFLSLKLKVIGVQKYVIILNLGLSFIKHMKYIFLSILLSLSQVIYADENDELDVFFDGTKTVHLKFINVADGKYNYTVDVMWTPDGYAAMGAGAAILRFSEKERLNSFSVTTEAFNLSGDILKKAGYYSSDDWSYHKDILNAVFTIDYNSLNKSSLLDNSHEGDAPFFFEDVDFDGANDLVILETGAGQRSVDAYKVYNLNKQGGRVSDLYSVVNKEPYTQFDALTTVNKEDKTIAFYSSGGSCQNSERTYKRIGGQLKYVQYKKWRQSASMIVGYICTESTFDIVNGQKVLKTESDDYYDDDKHRWIEICDEDAAINSQSYLEFLMRNEVCLAGGLLE
jgi:hypothetical protein